jgi:hypothetical protein
MNRNNFEIRIENSLLQENRKKLTKKLTLSYRKSLNFKKNDNLNLKLNQNDYLDIIENCNELNIDMRYIKSTITKFNVSILSKKKMLFFFLSKQNEKIKKKCL